MPDQTFLPNYHGQFIMCHITSTVCSLQESVPTACISKTREGLFSSPNHNECTVCHISLSLSLSLSTALSQRRELHLLVMMHKAINNQAPSYLTRCITPVSDRLVERGTQGAETFLMELPLCRTVKGQGAFSFAGPKLWNSLPPDIRILAACSKNVFQNAVIGWQRSNMINPT